VLSDFLFKRTWPAVLGVTAIAVLAGGCAVSPDSQVTDEEGRVPLADSEAAFGYEQTDWKKPFWERWLDDAREQGRADAVRSGQAQPVAARAAAPMAAPADGAPLRPKIGVYIKGGDRDSMASYRLITALEQQAARHGLSLIEPDELDEAVGGSDACASDTPLDCPKLLAIFPGIRSLLVVTPRMSGNDTTVETQMIDPDFGIDYDTVSTRLELGSNSAGTGSDVAIWSDRILGMAADRVGIAPWFTHSFALKGEDMYISAGQMSGLEVDGQLAVHGEGSLVRSPTGQVIAWEPGPKEGELRVKQFVGHHIAVVEQVSGRRPTPKDRLTHID
jgi:hypothetical protein